MNPFESSYTPKEEFARDLTNHYIHKGKIDRPTAETLYTDTLSFLSDKTLIVITPDMVHRLVNQAGFALKEMAVQSIVDQLSDEANAGRLITERIMALAAADGRELNDNEKFQVGDGKVISDPDAPDVPVMEHEPLDAEVLAELDHVELVPLAEA